MRIEIFKNIRDSLYNPDFYKSRLAVSGGRAFGYFVKLVLLEALVLVVVFSFTTIPIISSFLSTENIDKIVAMYPQELEITLKGGKASTNVIEPYEILLPAELNSGSNNTNSKKTPKNFIVIDTKSSFTLESFESYDTAVLLTRDYLVSVKSQGSQLQIQKLADFPDVVVNSAQIDSWVSKIQPLLKLVAPMLILGMFIGAFILSLIASLFLILVLSLITWIVQLIKKSGITYTHCFKLGLYAITLPIVFAVIFEILGINLGWFIPPLIFLIAFFANTANLSTKA